MKLPALVLATALVTKGCGSLRAPGAAYLAGAGGGSLAKTNPAFGAAVDGLFDTMTAQTPGAAVVVVDRGKVIHKKGYGMADLEKKTPVGTDTVFDLASVSKTFTAFGVMTLVEKGKLGYDDPLAKFFPRFKGAAGAITVRQLLNHTSGLKDYMALYQEKVESGAWKPTFEPTSKDVLALLAEQAELDFAPGSQYTYSNSGYVVLAQIVEKVVGQKFPAFMSQAVFQPLGMGHTRVYDETRPTDARRAKSYRFSDNHYQNIDYTPLNLIYGDGNVNSSIDDMAGFVRAFEPGVLVSAASRKLAATPPKLPANAESHYGFGLLVGRTVAGKQQLMHNGAWVGFRSAFITMPGQKRMAVVLANSTGVVALPLTNEVLNQLGR